MCKEWQVGANFAYRAEICQFGAEQTQLVTAVQFFVTSALLKQRHNPRVHTKLGQDDDESCRRP